MKVYVNGKNLKIARIKRGMYQCEVAKAIGIHQAVYSQIENGKSAECKTAKKICDFFDMAFDNLFMITESEV